MIGWIIVAVIVLVAAYARGAEKRDWNGGRCDVCRHPWRRFDCDSAGARGYTCFCARRIWISYDVDKNYQHEGER
jgi:hypothetical protein